MRETRGLDSMRHQVLFHSISVSEVRSRLEGGREIALLDVREEGPYAQSHPLFAASLPLSRLELEVLDRLPRSTVPVVVYDDGEGLTALAMERLRHLGYSHVGCLDGGLRAWAEAGAELFQDVNVPSKAFGELVDVTRHTPSIGPEELAAKVRSGDDVVILDARRFEEYRTMSIPSATSVPGGELVLRVHDLAPDPDTMVVVNCAGRTRSIIGAQSLVNAGIPNPVAALRNGTIGWTLAGLPLDRGQSRSFAASDAAGAAPAVAAIATAARRLAVAAGVRHITPAVLREWTADTTRTVYRFDVRTPEEYAAGHAPGFRSAPGGQLVQETDYFAPVRGARIVLSDTDGVRANMSASWLAQMGWDVSVLLAEPRDEAGDSAALETGPFRPSLPILPDVATIDAAQLESLLATQAVTVVDLSSSVDYDRGHVPGAWFALRSQLHNTPSAVWCNVPVVLVSADGVLARFAAAELATLTGMPPQVLRGGMGAWRAHGGPVESGHSRALSPSIDAYKRPYEGTDNPKEAMQGYLDWEFGLVAQLERDNTHHFQVL